MNFIKRENKKTKLKTKKLKVYKINTHKKVVIALWILLIASFCFAVYKNFAQDYYTWQPSQASIDSRNEAIKKYLTEELQTLNVDTIRRDVPTSSTVQNVEIWSVKQDVEKQFQVIFTVDQLIVDGKNKENVNSAYEVIVYVDGSGNMVIIKNPTICSIPAKSSYQPKESDGTADAATTGEINEFLKTFFKLYPTATEKELSYYVKNNALKPIGKDYVFAEIMNPIYTKKGNQLKYLYR